MKVVDRQIVKIIKEICEENHIPIKIYSHGWIMQLEINREFIYIFGYQFQNNNSAAQLICEDKAALSEILESCNISAVKHHFFVSPNTRHYIEATDCWTEMIGLLDKYGVIVCKKNDGSGGNGVFKVETRLELEIAVDNLFRNNRNLVISPYYEIEVEYRVIVLNNKTELIYSKERMFVEGNGVDTIKELVSEKYANQDNIFLSNLSLLSLLNSIDSSDCDLVLEAGRKYNLNWKHNLGKGAEPIILQDEKEKENLTDIALSAAAVIGVNFASVDIIKTAKGEYLILEINSGIMMEQFAKHSEEYYKIAKEIYKKAVYSNDTRR